MNFRDLGGLPAATGTTRSGVLFRSGALSGAGAEGSAVLESLGIRRVIDLRDDDEVARAPADLAGFSPETIRIPLFEGSAQSFLRGDVSLHGLYHSIVEDSAARVVAVVRAVHTGGPALVHCAIGKDRTGVTIALTLAAAGVDEEAIIADYALTESHLPASYRRGIIARLRGAGGASDAIEALMTRSPANEMRALLQGLTDRYGSPRAYLHAHGTTADEIVRVRELLIDPS